MQRPTFPLSRFAFVGMAAWLVAQGVSARAAAVDYLVDTWDTEKDLPSSTVTSLAQTPDGYLWVGTYDGLARFDGARFVTFDPVNTPELTQPRVQALYLDANGTLWISTFRGGLTSYRDGVFRKEWPDQTMFDLHTTLASSSSNQVTFVTQFGNVLQRDPGAAPTEWRQVTPPTGTRPFFQCADARGRLWFLGRDGHILQFADGAFMQLTNNGGLGTNQVHTLTTDAAGVVWAGAQNEIASWNVDHFEDATPTNGEPGIEPTSLFPTRRGTLWVLDGDRFREMKDRKWISEATKWRGLLGPASYRAMGMHEDRDGGLWFNHYGNGLFHVTPDGEFQRLTAQDELPGDRVGAWFQGGDGGIWIGMDHGGLARLRERRFHVIGTAEGFPPRTAALSVCQDDSGTVWIGTGGGGLCRWSGGRITKFPIGPLASANFVFSIFPLAGGGAWLSAAEGEDLFQFRNGLIQRAPRDVHGIKSMLTDDSGRLWLGTKAGIVWLDGNTQRVLGTNANNGNAILSAVRALAKTPDGTIWAGTDDGVLYRCQTNQLVPFRPNDALAEQPIYSLHADKQGVLWAGTFRGGLLRFKDGKFARITAKQGLPVDVIGQILEDDGGRFWLGTHQGIYCVSQAALDACADGRTNRLNYVTYGRHDGLPSLECSDGYQPACWRDADGRLWFATSRGVVNVNPSEMTPAPIAPPVLIEEMRVGGELVSLRSGTSHQNGVSKIIIPPGYNQFDFRFTALNFDAGERARFRYRLDGLDTEWVDAETRRTAHYGLLQPGDYRFRVAACNNEGVWNETGASLAFTVKPYFYQTAWFTILVSVGILGGVAFAARRITTAKYRRRLAKLEQQHAVERDRARIAKDIHDDIGAGLTQITLLTELARREPQQVGGHLDRITGSARQLTRAMDEIVWAVDPQHDTLNGLMDYVSAFAEDFLRTAGIRCRMDLPVTLPEAHVDAEMRYNLFLALKEALNNIAKHSKATEAWLRLRIDPKSFTLIVEDNGQGMPAARNGEANNGSPRNGEAVAVSDRITSGSGLVNLEKRLSAIGGRCQIHSAAGQGTRVEMTVAITYVASPVVAIGQDEDVD